VRDALLDRPVRDIDIATDARPDQMISLADAAGIKAVPTGADHGTVTLIAKGVPHEVTTFRDDLETDGRRAVVRFSDDVADDAARRDFTMNALYATPDGQVVDPLGGLADLMARRLKFVGDPTARISEDYLRILRFFRFHAWYGNPDEGMDAEALAAIAKEAEGIARLSRERVGQEMRKLLSAPDPSPSIAVMRQTGVLAQVLVGADDRALAPLVHLERDVPPDAIRRLACLGGIEPDVVLRLSKADGRRLDLLRREVGGTAGPGELGYRYGSTTAQDVLLLRAAMLEMPFDPGDLVRAQNGAEARFPVKATDLMPEYQGAALGAKLAELEDRWIASGFALDRAELLTDPGV
jgi:poly(A) polymerase